MLFDISPPISAALAVWPGDTPVRREVLEDMRAGGIVTLSTLHGTVHAGAHADAPNHYVEDGEGIDQVAVERYLGECQVIRVDVPRGAAIGPADVKTPLNAARVLFATGTRPDPATFNRDFAALSVELVDCLQAAGVRLVGIDTPSVDLFVDKALPVHRRLGELGILILEGLDLTQVPAGKYELIALPLRLMDFDASPVRAVLRSLAR
ncbi:MAG: cyclase family protein [Planctomycetota bacterium]